MRKNLFPWIALVIAILVVPPAPMVKAQAESALSGTESSYHFTLLFCIIVSGLCLIGCFLSTCLKKD